VSDTAGGKQTVYVVVRRGGGGRSHIHTDEDCQRLKCARSYSEEEMESVPEEKLCGFCSGDAEMRAPENPFATRDLLASLDPEDVGLSAIGERVPGGDTA